MNEKIKDQLKNAIIGGNTEVLLKNIDKIIRSKKEDPLKIIQDAMIPAIRNVGDMFGRGEIFLPEMLMAAETFQSGMKVIEPKLVASGRRIEKIGKVVFGTVLNDIHEIGKNIVITLMRTHGFEVYDIGANVSPITFVEKAKDVGADIIAMSALMTTTMTYQKDVIDYLREEGERDKYIILVGGGPVDNEWAEKIGADGTSDTAPGAVELAERLILERKREAR